MNTLTKHQRNHCALVASLPLILGLLTCLANAYGLVSFRYPAWTMMLALLLASAGFYWHTRREFLLAHVTTKALLDKAIAECQYRPPTPPQMALTSTLRATVTRTTARRMCLVFGGGADLPDKLGVPRERTTRHGPMRKLVVTLRPERHKSTQSELFTVALYEMRPVKAKKPGAVTRSCDPDAGLDVVEEPH